VLLTNGERGGVSPETLRDKQAPGITNLYKTRPPKFR